MSAHMVVARNRAMAHMAFVGLPSWDWPQQLCLQASCQLPCISKILRPFNIGHRLHIGTMLWPASGSPHYKIHAFWVYQRCIPREPRIPSLRIIPSILPDIIYGIPGDPK